MKQRYFIFQLIFAVILISSCNKSPGEGGTSTIQGHVNVINIDRYGDVKSKQVAKEVRVYIKYGDDDSYGNDVRTDNDGFYEFNFLAKGDYSIYAFGECDTCDSGLEESLVTVSINKNREIFQAPDIEINNILKPDQGTSTIKGKVYVKEYDQQGQLIGEYYGPEIRVYLTYSDEVTYFTDMRTHSDGGYWFPKLIKGDYTVFTYSDCDTCSSGTIVVEKTTVITEMNQVKDIPDIVINVQ